MIELMVAVTIVAISVGVSTVAFAGLVTEPEADDWVLKLEAGRREASRSGRPVVVQSDSAHVVDPVLFLPNGMAVGDRIDPLTGELR